jgi:hypothetical protein
MHKTAYQATPTFPKNNKAQRGNEMGALLLPKARAYVRV